MAVAIRMSRGGSKKRPYYKIVVADVRAPRDGKFIERIGSYNPLLAKDDEKRVVLDTERAKHWLEMGAKPSDRVARFLDVAGLLKREARNNPNKAKPGEKATERLEEKAEKAAAAEEAAKEAAAAPAPVEEAPAEEAAAETPAEETPAAEAAPAEEVKAEEAPAPEAATETATEAKPTEEAKAEETPAPEAAPAEEAKAEEKA